MTDLIIVLMIVLVTGFLVVRHLMKQWNDSKNGSPCGGQCSSCHSSCDSIKLIKIDPKELSFNQQSHTKFQKNTEDHSQKHF